MKIRVSVLSTAQADYVDPTAPAGAKPMRYGRIVGHSPDLPAPGKVVCVFGPSPEALINDTFQGLRHGIAEDVPTSQAGIAIDTYGTLVSQDSHSDVVKLKCRGVRVLEGAELVLHRQAEALADMMAQAQLTHDTADFPALWRLVEKFAERSGWTARPTMSDLRPPSPAPARELPAPTSLRPAEELPPAVTLAPVPEDKPVPVMALVPQEAAPVMAAVIEQTPAKPEPQVEADKPVPAEPVSVQPVLVESEAPAWVADAVEPVSLPDPVEPVASIPEPVPEVAQVQPAPVEEPAPPVSAPAPVLAPRPRGVLGRMGPRRMAVAP